MATQAGFAQRIGVSVSYIRRVENGQIKMPAKLAKRIAAAVGVDWQSLMNPAGVPMLSPLVGFYHELARSPRQQLAVLDPGVSGLLVDMGRDLGAKLELPQACGKPMVTDVPAPSGTIVVRDCQELAPRTVDAQTTRADGSLLLEFTVEVFRRWCGEGADAEHANILQIACEADRDAALLEVRALLDAAAQRNRFLPVLSSLRSHVREAAHAHGIADSVARVYKEIL